MNHFATPSQVTLRLAWSDFPLLFSALLRADHPGGNPKMVIVWGDDGSLCQDLQYFWQQLAPDYVIKQAVVTSGSMDLATHDRLAHCVSNQPTATTIPTQAPPYLTELHLPDPQGSYLSNFYEVEPGTRWDHHLSGVWANFLVLNASLQVGIAVSQIAPAAHSHRLDQPLSVDHWRVCLTLEPEEITALLGLPGIAALLPAEFPLSIDWQQQKAALQAFWRNLSKLTSLPTENHPATPSTTVPLSHLPSSPMQDVVVQQSPIGIMEMGLDGGITRANPAFCQLTGYTEAQLRHLDNRAISHPEDFSTEVSIVQQLLVNEQHHVFRKRYRCYDGSFVWTEIKLALLGDSSTDEVTILAFVTDLSERKLAEQEIQQSRAREVLLNDIGAQIRASFDLQSILQVAVERLRQALDTDRVLAYQFFPDYSGVCLAESVSLLHPPMLGQRFPPECIPFAYIDAYRRGRLHSTADIQTINMAECHRAMLDQFHVRATISTSLVSMDEALEPQNRTLWGLLVIHHCRGARHWTTNEEQLVRAVADQIVTALEQTRLLHQLQIYTHELENRVSQRTRSLERSLKFEQLIRTLTETLRRDLDEDQTLQEAVQGLVKTLEVDGCIASLFDHQNQTLNIRYEFFQDTISPQQSLVGQAIDLTWWHTTCCQTFVFNKTCISSLALPQTALQPLDLKHILFHDDTAASSQPTVMAHRLTCPIGDEQGLMGLITIFQIQAAPFATEEINLVEQVASQCVIALRRATLYHQEHEQRLSADYFRLFLEKSNDIFVEYDSDLRYISINPAGCQLLGLSANDIMGKTNQEILGTAAATIDELIRHAFATGEKVFVDHEFALPDGARVFEIIYAPITNPAGVVKRVIGICRDITELKQQWQLLETRNHQLAETTRLKEEFVATTSHELRTPLTAILGFSNVLLQEFFGELNTKQKDYLERIHSSGQHLLDLINDILDLSRLEADRLELDLQMVFVPDICEGVISLIQERAMSQGLTLEIDLDPIVDWMVIDPRRLKQMLLNLLTNAVKFTQEGSIGLIVYRQAAASVNLLSPHSSSNQAQPSASLSTVSIATTDMIHFTVWDTGIGIDKADQQLLFAPFCQIDSSLSRKHQGTGLGLVITRKLAELHDGTIHLESTLGQGSRFTISLPLKTTV